MSLRVVSDGARLALGLALMLAAAPMAHAAGDVDLEISGKPTDGFDKSIFKLYLPNNAKQVRAVIVFRTPIFGDIESDWRDLASRARCGLLWYSAFTSKATADRIARLPESKRPVEDGEALLAALRELAVRTRHPELLDAPIALWSFEGEVGFAVRFLQKNPDRVLALTAIHPRCGSDIGEKLGADAMKVPALFIHRDGDNAGWIAAIKVLCDSGRTAGAPWCSVITHNGPGGHLGDSSKLAMAYIEACVKLRTEETSFRRPAGADHVPLKPVDLEKGWFIDTASRESFAALQRKAGREALGWLPDERCTTRWKELSRPRRGN